MGENRDVTMSNLVSEQPHANLVVEGLEDRTLYTLSADQLDENILQYSELNFRVWPPPPPHQPQMFPNPPGQNAAPSLSKFEDEGTYDNTMSLVICDGD